MVTRHLLKVETVLYSKDLSCYPVEDQAAKIFVEWLKEHSEYSISDVHMKIISREREEDHHGNGGGFDHIVQIYQERNETSEEYQARIAIEESDCLDSLRKDLKPILTKFVTNCDLFPLEKSIPLLRVLRSL
jgi:hypothetical protein